MRLGSDRTEPAGGRASFGNTADDHHGVGLRPGQFTADGGNCRNSRWWTPEKPRRRYSARRAAPALVIQSKAKTLESSR
jgi:hypothetical protein